MTAKDYLRRIRQLDDAASAAQLELERIESTVTRVTACHKRFFAGKGTDDADRMANAVERLQRARERCNQAIDDYMDYRDHCRELMDMLQSPLHRHAAARARTMRSNSFGSFTRGHGDRASRRQSGLTWWHLSAACRRSASRRDCVGMQTMSRGRKLKTATSCRLRPFSAARGGTMSTAPQRRGSNHSGRSEQIPH